MDIYENLVLVFVLWRRKLKFVLKKLIICNFSKHTGDPSDVETFLNILLFLVDNSV